MAKKKKTIGVLPLLEFANKQLERTDELGTVHFKLGVSAMIERVLIDSGNYNGFMFLNNEDCESGTLGYYSRKYY